MGVMGVADAIILVDLILRRCRKIWPGSEHVSEDV